MPFTTYQSQIFKLTAVRKHRSVQFVVIGPYLILTILIKNGLFILLSKLGFCHTSQEN